MVKIFKREINFTNHEENICSSAITIGAKKGGHPPRPLQSERERVTPKEERQKRRFGRGRRGHEASRE